jgi:hypothetical protein
VASERRAPPRASIPIRQPRRSTPARTITDSTANRSASGPKTIIETGIATDITIP